MATHSVIDDGDSKRYFTQLPNIVFEIGLSPLELALYAHLKRAAGANPNGRCTKSTATLARETGMGAGTVSRTKSALEGKRPALGNRPLIKTKEVPNPRGGKPFQEITITDIWKISTDRFAPSSVEVDPLEPSSALEVGSQNQVPVEVDPSSKPTSTLEIKKNSKNNKREEEKRDFITDLKANPLYSHVDFDLELAKMRDWLARPVNQNRRLTERFVMNWINGIDRPVTLPDPTPAPTISDRLKREEELKKKMGWDRLERRTA